MRINGGPKRRSGLRQAGSFPWGTFSRRIDSKLSIPCTFYAFQNILWKEVVYARPKSTAKHGLSRKFLRRGLTHKLSLAESERAVLCNGREGERVRGQLAESGKTLLLVKRGPLFDDKTFILLNVFWYEVLAHHGMRA